MFNWVNNNIAAVKIDFCGLFVWCGYRCGFPSDLSTDNSFISTFSVYSGHHTILIPPGDLETNPALWLSVVSQYKG